MDAYEHAALTYECSEKVLNYMLARELAEGKGVSEANLFHNFDFYSSRAFSSLPYSE